MEFQSLIDDDLSLQMPAKRFKPNVSVTRERKIGSPKHGKGIRGRLRRPSQSSGNESDTPQSCTNTLRTISTDTHTLKPSDSCPNVRPGSPGTTPTLSLIRGVTQTPAATPKGKKKVAPCMVARRPKNRPMEPCQEATCTQPISPDPMNDLLDPIGTESNVPDPTDATPYHGNILTSGHHNRRHSNEHKC